ncbi:MAG: aldo/keto reductase [Armatimonadota bacterium]
MITRALGKSGITVSAVGLGTWAIGGSWWGGTDEGDSIAAIRRGLDEGITLIDTAPVYGYGLSEELVGRAIAGRKREDMVLATKVGLNWVSDEGVLHFERDGRRVFRNLRPASIRSEVEQSLRRLNTDYIDLYQTHWQDATTPISDTMGELLKLKEEGKIRAIGVSNASIAEMEQYLACGQLDANQPKYNMLDRQIEAEMLPFCRARAIAILSYSSLALGILTGKISPERTFPPDDLRANSPRYTPENIRRVNGILEQLSPFREKYGMEQTQLTIAWTISRPGVTCALVGARNPHQAAGIAPGGKTEISAADLAEMDRITANLGTM